MSADAFSAITTTAAFVLAFVTRGIIEASTTRSPVTPWTLHHMLIQIAGLKFDKRIPGRLGSGITEVLDQLLNFDLHPHSSFYKFLQRDTKRYPLSQ